MLLSVQPTDFKGVSIDPTSITFTWKPPQDIKDMVTNYAFQCSSPETGVTHRLNFNNSQNTTTLKGLLPYTNYSCNITGIREGPPETISVTTQQDGEAIYF